MSSHVWNERVLDARPDSIDYRDRIYSPPLVSLPPIFPSPEEISGYLPAYTRSDKILNQYSEGACTGFGLAAVINYITWDKWLRSNGGNPKAADPPVHVSEWMLYDNARVYDEWEGEDYSGSSCRGAMKGWHKHGVCRSEYWPKLTSANNSPNPEWREDAALRPLGAYYRVEIRSISDMQAAIHEVKAVYCSARVHEGWSLPENGPCETIAGLNVPVIALEPGITGGHAFAIVGYTENGFIIQNSWGPKWGQGGFAIMTYEDWIHNGDDAWVAALAAPTRVNGNAVSLSSFSKQPMQLMTASFALNSSANNGVEPWSEAKAYERSVVMGNDGRLLRRLIGIRNGQDNLHKVVFENAKEGIEAGAEHVLIYAHGGLNSEDAAIKRARRLGPWFEANKIHPIFLVWRTSFMESIGQIGLDFVGQFIKERDEIRAEGLRDFLDNVLERAQKKFDRAFEAAAEKFVGKPVWSQMKQNAHAASNGTGGTRQLIEKIKELRIEHPNIPIHMIGHSAGAILLGHMLDDLDDKSGLQTIGLYAPACSMSFANRYFGRALKREVIAKGNLHVDVLSEDNERDDTVGPYGKSLLYLVSRAFEDPRKMPLLGLEKCWKPTSDQLSELKKSLGPDFAENEIKYIRDWDNIRKVHKVGFEVHSDHEITTKKSKQGNTQIKTTHGSFDNNLFVINESVKRILKRAKPVVEITDLTGF